MNNTQIPEDIRQFLDNILQEAGMLTLDDPMREGMIEELFYQLDNYISSVMVKNLEPQDLETFIKMNEEKKSKEEIETFISQKIPNSQEIFTNALRDFRKLYLENIAASDKNSDTE